jgi:hypothetical protein
MPQANITYDTPINRALANKVLAKERVKATREEADYFPFRLESFHNPKTKGWVGGGPPREYIINGNSPAYPPLHMRSSMEVSSGGRYAGTDGAVGGSFWKDFAKGFTSVLDVAAAPLSFVAPEIAAPIAAASEGVKALAGSGMSGGAMSGAGKGGRAKRADIVKKIMKERGVKMIEASKIVKREGLYKSGGAMSGAGIHGSAIGGAMSGAGKKTKKTKGYAAVKDDVELAKVMDGSGMSGGQVSGGAESGGAMSGAGKKKKRAVGASDGRAKRAEIVKKIMKERGVKMIEASKIVKKEGLY